MFLMILIDIIILVAVGIPIFLLYRRWHAWVEREPASDRPFQGRRRFGLRSWAARSFVLDKPVAHVKEMIDSLPEMSYAEAAAMIEARGRTGSVMALAPLTGKQVFETGIEIDWLTHDTVEIRAHSYADWPLNALDDAALPAKQHQMLFEHAILRVEPDGEKHARLDYELRTPVWTYLLCGAIILLVVWIAWLIGRTLAPAADIARMNLAGMAVLTAWVITRVTEVLRLQSIGLMDSIIRTFGAPVPDDE